MGPGRFRAFDARRVFGHAFRRAGRTVGTVLEMDAGRLERRQVARPSVSSHHSRREGFCIRPSRQVRRSCASPNTRRLDTCRFGLRHVSGAFRVTITLQQDVQFSNQYPIREAINSRDTHGERIGGHPQKDEEAEDWAKDMNSRDCQREVECIDLPFCVKASGGLFRQQPDGGAGDTPGVAAAPVALAGGIVPGVARFIVMLSAQADVFGVGTTVIVGSILVPTSWVISGWIVPGGGFAGISGVESGKAAPLVGGPAGVELHTVVDELPSGVVGDVIPVVLPTIGVGMLPNAATGIIALDNIVVVDGVIVVDGTIDVETVLGAVDGVGTGVLLNAERGAVGGSGIPGAGGGMAGLEIVDAAEAAGVAGVVGGADIDDVVPVVPLVADMAVTATASVAGVISPDGVAQVTTVPGVEGSEAIGTGASVVSAAPGWVVAENGLGPLSGEDRTVPGVDGRPMAVLPMVETCARQAWAPNSRMAVVNSKRRIAIPSATRRSSLSAPCAPCAPRPCCPPPGSPSD
jgi:hypothetical protein